MAGEQQIHAARNALAEQLDAAFHELARGAKLALLVVLAVLGQVALGHDAQDAAAVHYDRGVEQSALDP